ncbi:MAG TPA: sugar ABC transporter substrate-binding protein [Devosiaceae bacterium]|jgi:multiple sugar transport system substrate-binding protein|nr:sugar ABC transporter substrate-binding protein [Devosiaceae bacterium]
MTHHHKLLAAALAVGTVLTTAAPAAAQELRMTIWSANEAHLALFNEIADAYEAEHEGVSITFDSLPFDNYTTTLTTQIAGGNPPDLAWILETTAADFVSSGALAPLRGKLEATEGYDLADVTDSALALWSADGEIYAYPFSTSPFGMFVNNDLVREAGQQTPAELIAAGEWTWDKALEIAAAVGATGTDGLIVRDFNFVNWQNLATIYKGWGAAPWSEDGTTCTFAEQPMVDAMSRIHQAIFADNAMPGPGESVDFFTGDAAMTITQISRASLLPQDDPFDWDLVPLPAGPAGEYAVIGQAGIGVLASGDNVDVATDFLAFFSNPENSRKLAQFFPPARASLLTTEVLAAANPLLSPEQLEAVVIEGIATGEVIPGHTNFAEIQQTVRAGLDALWVPDADVPAVLQSLCDRIQPML